MTIRDLGIQPGVASAEALIKIDGEDISDLVSLQTLLVEEQIDGLYRCELRVGSWGTADDGVYTRFMDRDLIDFGKALSISMGVDDAQEEIFSGKISALEGQFPESAPPALVVLAEDGLDALRVTRRTRTFEDMSDTEIFEQIAQDHGLSSDIDVDDSTQRVIAQINQSDLAFMRERSHRLAAEIWLDDGTLYVKSRSARSSDSDTFRLQYRRGLMAFSVTADLANVYTKVKVTGWSVQAKDRIQFEASASAISNEVGAGDSGVSIAQEVYGERIDRIVRHQPLDDGEAQAIAEAAFRQQARKFVVGRGTARGDGRIRVGRKLIIGGVSPLFSGEYIVTETRHIFRRGNGGGYTTDFVVERPIIGSA